MIEGIDVSNWQSNYGTHIDWTKAASNPIKFVYIKAGSCNATDGVCWTDSSFLYNAEQVPNYFSAFGFYWYFRPDKNPVVQADYFVNLLLGKNYNLPPVCDIEVEGQASAVQQFCNEVWNKTGKKPMIYTSPNAWLYKLTGDKTWAKALYLWEAHWGVASPMVIAPWTGWDVWQYNVLPDAWKYGVPLPPNGTTNLDHSKMQDAFFPQPIPPTPPPSPCPPCPELETNLADLQQGYTALSNEFASLRNDVDKLMKTQPSSLAVPYAIFHVNGTVPARFIGGFNKAIPKKPVFEIYPSDTSEVKDRIMLNGTYKVFPSAFLGDSSVYAYAILDPILPGVSLYIRNQDGIISAT